MKHLTNPVYQGQLNDKHAARIAEIVAEVLKPLPHGTVKEAGNIIVTLGDIVPGTVPSHLHEGQITIGLDFPHGTTLRQASTYWGVLIGTYLSREGRKPETLPQLHYGIDDGAINLTFENQKQVNSFFDSLQHRPLIGQQPPVFRS